MITHEIKTETSSLSFRHGEVGIEPICIEECRANVMVSLHLEQEQSEDFVEDLKELLQRYAI